MPRVAAGIWAGAYWFNGCSFLVDGFEGQDPWKCLRTAGFSLFL
jgi:hypothetical protein